MLIWITQLGISVALPPAGFIFLAVWLRSRFELGKWVIIVGCAVGLICAVEGLRNCLKTMEMMDKRNERKDPPPTSFNDHD